MRSSSNFNNIEVFFHISSSWVKIRLHTEKQLPRLPGSALKVPGGGGGVASYPLSSQAPTPVEVELGCDNYSNSHSRCSWTFFFNSSIPETPSPFDLVKNLKVPKITEISFQDVAGHFYKK